MSEDHNTKAPKWFKLVAIIALIWNILGVFNYVMTVTMGPEALANLTEAQQAYMIAVPMWVTAAFAFAVWGGFAGTVALVHSFFMSNYMEAFGAGPTIFFLLVFPIGIYLVWLARSAKAKGWIS